MQDDVTAFDKADESLLYAFAGLLNRLNIEADLNQLHTDLKGQDLNFESLTEGEYVHITERGDYGSWPASNNAIIRFQYQDHDQPYIEINGQREANIIDHYCLISEFEHRSIIDSNDGAIKEGSQYGQPVSWAVFEHGVKPVEPATTVNPATNYRVLRGGESGWEIARKLNVDAKALQEHNDIEDMAKVPEYTILHLPFARSVEKRPEPQIEIMRRPLQMHISVDGGVRKQSFGNAKTVDDISETGPKYAKYHKVNIFAIARVPVGDEELVYYMESSEFDTATKRIRWTIGFSEKHVLPGHITPPVEQPKPQLQEIIATKLAEAEARKTPLENAELRKQMIIDVEAEDKPPSKRMGVQSLQIVDKENSDWQASYVPFENGSVIYIFKDNLIIRDISGRRRNIFVKYLEGVTIAGTFIGPDNEEYGLPADAAIERTWYGVPMDKIMTKEELYRTKLNLAERVAIRGKLTPIEQFFTVPFAKATARSDWLRNRSKKLKKD